MADAFKGLTLRIGADARPLKSAIDSIVSKTREANTQFNRLSKALKFDTTNVKAMESRLDLAGDKAMLTATAAKKIETSVQQASQAMVTFSSRSGLVSGTMEKVASRTDKVYSSVERVKQAYNSVNTELEHIYDACIQVARVKFDMNAEEAKQHVLDLKRALNQGGDAAASARKQLESLIRSAATTTDIAADFGFDKSLASASKLVGVWTKLRAAHKDYKADLKSLESVEGFRNAQTQLIAYESELRQACEEVVRFKAEMYAIGGASGLDKAVADAKRLDAAVDAASESSRKMSEAFKQAPLSLDTARAKAAAFTSEQTALEHKLKAVEEVLDKIGNSKGFSKQRALMTDVWTAAEKAKGKYAEIDMKLKLLEAEYDELTAKIKKAENAEKSLSAEAKSDLEQDRAKLENLNSEIDQLKSELRQVDAVVKSTQLDKKFREASEEAVTLRARIQQINDQMSRLKSYQSSFESLRRIGYGLYTTITQALTRVGRYAITSAEEIDSAYRDMRKTVNGTEADFESLKAAALDFSSTHFTSADQILEIESIGGQLGIAVSELQDFGEVVANLDIATNMETEDIALDLAKLSNVLHFTNEEYDNFADALVRLGNNEPALESDIMTISMRFAGMASNVGMSTQDVLAFATAATATGQKAEAAGSSMQRTIGRIETAVASGGESLEAFARVSGMSAEQFAAVWSDTSNHGPARALQSFIEGLKGIKDSGGSVTKTLQDLGITGVRDKQLLSGLTNTTDVLSESLQMADDAWNGMSTTMSNGSIELAGDAAREAQRKSEGFSGQLQILQNNAQQLANALAEGATPIITALGEAFHGLTQWVTSLPAEIKTAVVVFGALAAALGPVLVATGAVGSAITGIGQAFRNIKSAGLWKEVASSFRASIDVMGTSASTAKRQITGLSTAAAASATATQAAGTKFKVAGTHIADFGTKAGRSASLFSRFKSAITTTFGTSFTGWLAIVTACGAAVAMLVNQVMDFLEAQENVKKSTQGFADAVSGSSASFDQLSSSVERAKESVLSTDKSYNDFFEHMATSRDEIVENKKATEEQIGTLEWAKDTIDKYMNSSEELSAVQQGDLANAVQIVNDKCSEQFSIVDILHGKIADATGAILNEKDAILEAVAAQEQKIRSNQLAAEAEELYQLKLENIAERRAAQKSYSNQLKWLEENYGADWQTTGKPINGTDKVYDEAVVLLETYKGRVDELTLAYDELTRAQQLNAEAAAANSKITAGLNVSVGELAKNSGELMTLFQTEFGEANYAPYFDQFQTFLESAHVTTSDFRNLEQHEMEALFDAWVQGLSDTNMTTDEILAAAGLSVRSLGSQYSDELAQIQVDFGAMAASLQTDTETLAQRLSDAGYSAIDLTNMSEEMLVTAGEAAIAAANEGKDGVQAFIDKLAELGQTDVEAEVDVDTEGAEDSVEDLQEDLEEVDDTEVEASVNYDEVEGAKKSVDELGWKIENIPDGETTVEAHTETAISNLNTVFALARMGASGTVTIGINDYATAALYNIQSILYALTSVSHTVSVAFTGGAATGAIATGGISSFARGGMFDHMISRIPMNAAGALNGIVTGPRLTNIGWVGEDGWEAVLHMGNAGGAVIPLSNTRYVRPFARAVASEMGGGASRIVNVEMNLNYDASDDAQALLRDIARGIEDAMSMEA